MRHLVLAGVDSVFGLELVAEPFAEHAVPDVAAEVVVAGGRDDLDEVVGDIEDGHVECAAAEVEDEDLLDFPAPAEAVCHGRRGRLVDDAQHLEAGYLPGVLGGLALVVVEICRDRDDGLLDGPPEEFLRVFFQLREHSGGHLLGQHPRPVGVYIGASLVARLDAVVEAFEVLVGEVVIGAPDEALHRVDGVVGIRNLLVEGGLPDYAVAVLPRDDRGSRPLAVGIDDDLRFPVLEDRHAGVGRPQIDADDLVGICHVSHCLSVA